jgi:hypothetical protein
MNPETKLPSDLLERASLRGNEYAWPIEDIPAVIDAAEKANLASLGGQLQFRLPDGGTCECYWVEVDALRDCPDNLTWKERVRITAAGTRQQFNELRQRYDFVSEGRDSFCKHLTELEASGGSVTDAMRFVWYVQSEESYSNSTIT